MWPPSAACPPWALLAAGAGVGRDSGWGSMAAGTALPSAGSVLPTPPPRILQIRNPCIIIIKSPELVQNVENFFSAAAFAFQFSVLPPLFQQSFFSFLIFFILPKFLSSFIIHLEEAIHLKSFYYIPIFLDPLIKKISRSSVFSKDNKARLFVEKKIIFNLHKVLSLNVLKYKIKFPTWTHSKQEKDMDWKLNLVQSAFGNFRQNKSRSCRFNCELKS